MQPVTCLLQGFRLKFTASQPKHSYHLLSTPDRLRLRLALVRRRHRLAGSEPTIVNGEFHFRPPSFKNLTGRDVSCLFKKDQLSVPRERLGHSRFGSVRSRPTLPNPSVKLPGSPGAGPFFSWHEQL